MRLQTIEVRVNDQRCSARESTVSPFGDDGFELNAFGDATLPAGAAAMIVMTLQTSLGEEQLELPSEILRIALPDIR